MGGGAWWAVVHGVAKNQTRLSVFTFTFHFHALEKDMATHSSVLAWRIPGMWEPGELPSMGSHRTGHDWSDLAAAVAEILHGFFQTPDSIIPRVYFCVSRIFKEAKRNSTSDLSWVLRYKQLWSHSLTNSDFSDIFSFTRRSTSSHKDNHTPPFASFSSLVSSKTYRFKPDLLLVFSR